MRDSQHLPCACCSKFAMAELVDNRLIFRKHDDQGRWHFAVVVLPEGAILNPSLDKVPEKV